MGFGKKGLNEMGGNGWDSDDVCYLNGIHLLTAGPALAQKDLRRTDSACSSRRKATGRTWSPATAKCKTSSV